MSETAAITAAVLLAGASVVVGVALLSVAAAFIVGGTLGLLAVGAYLRGAQPKAARRR